MRIPNFGVVDRHVDGGVSPHAVGGSDGPWLSACSEETAPQRTTPKGCEVSRGAKLARRRNRDPASDDSPKERQTPAIRELLYACRSLDLQAGSHSSTTSWRHRAGSRGLNRGRVEDRKLDEFGEGTVAVLHVELNNVGVRERCCVRRRPWSTRDHRSRASW